MLFSRPHSCHGHQILRSLLSLLNLIILKPCHRVSLKEAAWLLGLCRWLFETKLMIICLDSHLNVSTCYLKLLTVSSSSNTPSKSIKALPMSMLSHLETQLDPPHTHTHTAPPPHFPHRYIHFATRTVHHNIINCVVKPLLSGHQSINFLKFSSLIYCKFDLYSTVCLY